MTATTSLDRQRLLRLITGHWVAQTVRAAAELRLADHLAEQPCSAAELARREGSDPEATERLLHACLRIELVTRVGLDRFAATPLLGLLRADAPDSLRDTALVLAAPHNWLPWAHFPDAVRAGGARAAHTLGLSVFDYYAGRLAEAELFTGALGDAVDPGELAALIDTEGVRRIVDLGGGDGALLHALLHRDPRPEGIVLELPHAVAAAREATIRAGLAERVSVVAGDFFASVPEADLYLLKLVLGEFTDELCVRLLRGCRRAMRPGARLVVVDRVPDLGADTASRADAGLLAVLPGQDRTPAELDLLLAAARLARRGEVRGPGGLLVIDAGLT